MNTHSIGIDFGTYKTLVSHINHQTNIPETIRLGVGRDYIPTSAYIDSEGVISFGDEADDMLEDCTGRYLRGFKMKLGSSTPLHMYLENGQPRMLTAKELVKSYLQHIRQRVQQEVYHGEAVTAATITRPVNFSPAQCEELKQAALNAGFHTVNFATEPEAAGLAFCRQCSSNAFKHSALIVDWGGGTLDFALVTRHGNAIHTHSCLTGGDTTMGGEKFDEKLWIHAGNAINNKLNPITQLPKVRRAKEQLSSKDSTVLRLSYEGGTCPPLPIKRIDFEKLITDDINSAVHKIQALLSRIPAEHQPEMLLLVGGSSKIPLIKKKLEAACHLPAHSWDKSREAVAIGAALWGTASPADQNKSTPHGPIKQSTQPTQQQEKSATTDYYKKANELLIYNRLDDAFQTFYKGHEAGDFSCTSQLAICYRDGIGTPINYFEYIRLAKELETEQCPLAFALLAHAYSEGTGCKVDITTAESYARRWAKESTSSIPGVHEDCRLWMRALELENTAIGRIWTAQEEESQGNLSSPINFTKALTDFSNQITGAGKFAVQSMAWSCNNGGIENFPKHLLNGLEKEFADGQMLAATILLLLYLKSTNVDKNIERIKYLSKKITRESPTCYFAALCAFELADTEKEEKEFFNILWKRLQYGESLKKDTNSLPCELALSKPSFSCLIKAYNVKRVTELIDAGRLYETIVENNLPALVIHNVSNSTLSNLTLRVVLPGIGEHSFTISQSVPPNKSISLDLIDFDVNWNINFWLEVSDSSGRISRILPTPDVVQQFIPTVPPIFATWDRGFWGGMVLKLGCVSGTLTNVQLHKSDGSTCDAFDLTEDGDLQSIGWCEMSDNNGLEPDTFYAITCNEADLALCCLCSSDSDSGAGWKTASKIIGGALIGSLLGS